MRDRRLCALVIAKVCAFGSACSNLSFALVESRLMAPRRLVCSEERTRAGLALDLVPDGANVGALARAL